MLHDVSWAINLLAAVVHSDVKYCQKHIFRPWTTGAVRMPAGQNFLTVNGMRASKPAKDVLSACCCVLSVMPEMGLWLVVACKSFLPYSLHRQ